MRHRVITGPPPVQILDVTGPLEVFANIPDYQISLGTPEETAVLRTSRGFAITDATLLRDLTGSIDTLLIAGGPVAVSGVYNSYLVAWIAGLARRARPTTYSSPGSLLP